MPNMKNAIKKVKADAKKAISNNQFEAAMKTAMKKVEKAIKANDKENAKTAFDDFVKKVDKAAKKGVVKANFVARHKSRLSKQINNLK